MPAAPIRVLPTPEAIGEDMAGRLLEQIDAARDAGRRFLLGCPTGRTPRPIYQAVARRLSSTKQNLNHLVLVMMDEYLTRDGDGFRYADAHNAWSCHHFARVRIVEEWNRELAASHRLREESVWFPDPKAPAGYDERIGDAGGIDFFILASGASDGHVAFNPPGSPRDSRTRIVELSEQTRRDNLQTFPAFGSIDAVPTHGVSVGIATITAARAGVMVLTGASKRESLSRILKAEHYDPQWPATVVHEIAAGEILADREAAVGVG